MEFMEAIRNRRTCRVFEEKEIPNKILSEIIEAGYLAPTNDHLRKWEIITIRDMDKKKALLLEINKDRNRDVAVEIVNKSDMKDEDQKNMYIEAIPLQYKMLMYSGALILPFYYQNKNYNEFVSLSDFNYFASIWCVIENMLIAASGYGIMGVTRIPTEEERKKVKEIIGSPEKYEFPCYLSLGYPKYNETKIKQILINIEDHIHNDKW